MTPDEQALVRFEVAKTNLVDQMVLYGIDERQARIQVESLVELTMKAKEVTDRAVRGAEARDQVGRRQAQEGP